MENQIKVAAASLNIELTPSIMAIALRILNGADCDRFIALSAYDWDCLHDKTESATSAASKSLYPNGHPSRAAYKIIQAVLEQ